MKEKLPAVAVTASSDAGMLMKTQPSGIWLG